MKSHELLPLLPFLAPETLARTQIPDLTLLRAEGGPPTLLLRGSELAELKSRIAAGDGVLTEGLAKLRALADAACAAPLLSVTDKEAAPKGATRNDYASHAIYFWPNPETEDGLPYVRRDGEVNPQASDETRFDVRRLERLSETLFVLSLAYFLSGEEKYAKRAAEQLRVWFITPKTRQTPHFEFAQGITGKSRGRPEGLIEARRLTYVLDAEALIKASKAWSAADAEALRQWFSDFFTWFRTSKAGRGAAAKKNNIGLWYDAQAALYAIYLGERELAESIVRESVKERLPTQVALDGAPLQELDRARPYDYAAFNLLAMMGLARAGEAAGFDAWWAQTEDGRTFQRALEWSLRVAGTDRTSQAMDAGLKATRLEVQLAQAVAQALDAKATAKTQAASLEHARTRSAAAEARAAELATENQTLFDRVAEAERRADKSAETARKAEREQAKRTKISEEEKERADRTLSALEAAHRELENRSVDVRAANARAEAATSRAAEQDQRAAEAIGVAHAAELKVAGLTQDVAIERRRAEEIAAALAERTAIHEAVLAETREQAGKAEAKAHDVLATLESERASAERLARQLDAARAEAMQHANALRAANEMLAVAAAERDAALATAQEQRRDATALSEQIAAEQTRANTIEAALAALQAEFTSHAAVQAAKLAAARAEIATAHGVEQELEETRARALLGEEALAAALGALAEQQASAGVLKQGVADARAETVQAVQRAQEEALRAGDLTRVIEDERSRAGEIARERDDARSRAEEAASALAAVRAAADDARRAADEKHEQLAARAGDLTRALEDERSRAGELERERDDARSRAEAAARARAESHGAELERMSAEARGKAKLAAEAQKNLAAEIEKNARARAAAEQKTRQLKEVLAHKSQEEARLRQERAALQAKLMKARESIAAANQNIETIRSSTSWRVTEPLRGAVRLLRGERGDPGERDIARAAPSAPEPSFAPVGAAPPPTAAPPPFLNGKSPADILSSAALLSPVAPALTRPPPKKAPPSVRAPDKVLGSGCLPHYVATLQKSIGALEKSALRNRSLTARDLLARIATGGVLGYDQIEAILETEAEGGLAATLTETGPETFNKRAFSALARVVGNQAVTQTDYMHAVSLYEAFIEVFGGGELRPIDQVLLVDLLVHQNRRDRARAALDKSNLALAEPTEYVCLLANILHPGAQARAAEADAWVATLNRLFSPHGVEPISLTDAAGPMMTRLACAAPACGSDGAPLISILMTTFNPDPTLAMAIGSVLAQTWRRFELIIADDCSEESAFAEIKALEARDPRIRVLRMERNQGTYAAKNRALEVARGEFVTCHDSDDWSHPRKLERQVTALLGARNVVGNLSSWLRATPDMRIERFAGTGRMLYYNTSSMMFRREPVLAKCGYYDSVRTGADSELYRRIEIAFEQTLPTIAEPPLSFGQVRAGALTHLSLGNGWESPDRKIYRAAWGQWHRQLKAGEKDLRVDISGARKRFHAPSAVLPDQTGAAVKTFDVVIASDFRLSGGNISACVEEIKANAVAGLRTAVCQMNCYLPEVIGKDSFDDRILDFLREGKVEQVEIEEDVRCGVLLIRYPPVLQFIAGMRSGIRPAHVRIIANQPPAERDGTDRRYDVGACARNALALFGRPAIWAPTNAFARAAIAPGLASTQLTLADWSNILDVAEWRADRHGFVSAKPVIGRHAPDDPKKWPASAEMVRAIYPVDGSVDVRILGGANSAQKLLGREVPPWQVLAFGAMPPKTFLRGLDFFVYFQHPRHIEASGYAILEALAAGCVVILARDFEPLFGAAALYCEPTEVQALVRELYADKKRFLEQSRRGADYAAAHFGYEGYAARFDGLIAPR